VGGFQDILGGILVGIDGYLRDKPDAPARGDDDIALVLRELAGEQAKERGLARAVFAEKANALPGGDLEAEAVQDVFIDLEGFDEVVHGDVDHGDCTSLIVGSRALLPAAIA